MRFLHALSAPIIAVVALGACERAPAPETPAPSTSLRVPALATPTDAGAAKTSASPGAPPPAAGFIVTTAGPGEIEVESEDGQPVSLAMVARVDAMEADGSFRPHASTEDVFRLTETCEPSTAACVAVTKLRPAPWHGVPCGGVQCSLGCRGSSEFPALTARIVVTSCDRRATVASKPFTFPAAAGLSAMDRRWAADATVAAASMRLEDPRAGWDGTAAPRAGRLADFVVRPKTERVMDDAARASLVALLERDSGYDDAIEKRCAMHRLVGFRLTRTIPTTGASEKRQDGEIAIDLACQKIFVVRGDGPRRHVHASHFDPSRPAWLALVKQLHPGDPELR